MLKRLARLVTPGILRRWAQKRKLLHHIHSFHRRIVSHTYGNAQLRIELADGLAEGWYDHDWELPPELQILSAGQLRPGNRVFDIGAHQGIVGLILGKSVGTTGQVVLLEPNEHNFSQCQRNVDLNTMTWVTCQRAAVTDFVGTLRFNSGLNGTAAELGDYAGIIEVPATTLDELTKQYGPPNVVFLDVEGLECRALSCATKTFLANPDWAIEVHIGCGLEAAGSSSGEILSYFPPELYDRFIHRDGDKSATPFDEAHPDVFRSRFFLTALNRSDRKK